MAFMNGRDVLSRLGSAWHVHAFDTDVDAAAELIEQNAITHTSLNTADTIEVLSSEAGDTSQTLTVYGINSSNVKATETFELNGTSVVSGSTTFAYFDYATLDAECAGTITIREASGNAAITTVTVGNTRTYQVQHFNGEYDSYITAFSCGLQDSTGSIEFELRVYSDDDDCMDPGDGFEVIERIWVEKTAAGNKYNVRYFDPPIKVLAGSWICVYGTGSDANSNGFASITGFDDSPQ